MSKKNRCLFWPEYLDFLNSKTVQILAMNPETQFDFAYTYELKKAGLNKRLILSPGLSSWKRFSLGVLLGLLLDHLTAGLWSLSPPLPPAAAHPQHAERGKTRHSVPAQGLASAAVGGAEDLSFLKAQVNRVYGTGTGYRVH